MDDLVAGGTLSFFDVEHSTVWTKNVLLLSQVGGTLSFLLGILFTVAVWTQKKVLSTIDGPPRRPMGIKKSDFF